MSNKVEKNKGPSRNIQVKALAFWLIILFFAVGPTAAAEIRKEAKAVPPYVLGVFPFFPVTTLEAIFAPIAAELSVAVGRQVILKTTESYEKFMIALERREYDIAFVHPFDYVDIAKPKGYLPLAGRTEMLASKIVAKENSPLRSIRDLKGKSLGMPPVVAAVTILNRFVLRKEGLNPDKDLTMKYFTSHHACLQQLLVGNVDACGVSGQGIRLVEQQMQLKFKEIGQSPEIPHTLFVAKGQIPARERKVLTKTLIDTDLKQVAQEVRTIFVTPGQRPFRAITDKEYDSVRRYLRQIGRP